VKNGAKKRMTAVETPTKQKISDTFFIGFKCYFSTTKVRPLRKGRLKKNDNRSKKTIETRKAEPKTHIDRKNLNLIAKSTPKLCHESPSIAPQR
jgi:hypothetical protein